MNSMAYWASTARQPHRKMTAEPDRCSPDTCTRSTVDVCVAVTRTRFTARASVMTDRYRCGGFAARNSTLRQWLPSRFSNATQMAGIGGSMNAPPATGSGCRTYGSELGVCIGVHRCPICGEKFFSPFRPLRLRVSAFKFNSRESALICGSILLCALCAFCGHSDSLHRC